MREHARELSSFRPPAERPQTLHCQRPSGPMRAVWPFEALGCGGWTTWSRPPPESLETSAGL
eukprot:9543481-Lingulodinium_polyedra.AAC.1